MLSNPHQYLAETLVTTAHSVAGGRANQEQEEDSLSSAGSTSTTDDNQQDEDIPRDDQELDILRSPFSPLHQHQKRKAAFSTTVASIFGYGADTDDQSITSNFPDRQQHHQQQQQHHRVNDQLVATFINKERFVVRLFIGCSPSRPHLNNPTQGGKR